MKRQRIKDVATGAIVATLVVGTMPSAFAMVSKMNIPVNFNNIKIVIDGTELATDKEAFIYEGTTYLPVRAVAEAVGKEVAWNGETQTVTLSTAASTSTPAPAPEPSAPVEDKAPTQTQANEVLFEQNGIKITYVGISEGYLGKEIDLMIENTSDKNYVVQSKDFSLNGYMISPVFSCDIMAGKKANDEMTILSSYLEKNGITEINNFECAFHIFEDGNWDEQFDSEVISVKVK